MRCRGLQNSIRRSCPPRGTCRLWFALETFIVLTSINVNILTGIPRTPLIAAAGALGTMSLSLPMSVISGFSFLSMWCMVGGLLALVVCGIGNVQENTPHQLLDLSAMPSAVGMFLYCFSGLPCLPNIRAAMRRPEEYSSAVNLSFTFALGYYALVGLLGYHFFAQSTQESFTQNLWPLVGVQNRVFYCSFALISAALFAGKLQAGFPLYAAPVLQAMGFGSECEKHSPRLVWAARGAFAAVSISFAIFAQDALDAVAELMGAFLTTSTSILFPCAAYWAVRRLSGEPLNMAQVAGISLMLVFGVAFCVVGTMAACWRLWFEESASISARGGWSVPR